MTMPYKWHMAHVFRPVHQHRSTQNFTMERPGSFQQQAEPGGLGDRILSGVQRQCLSFLEAEARC